MLPGVVACFLLSGFAALLYQTAWMRQFSLVFGTSELAVATVLAAYMGGLALGARVIEIFLDRVRQPVLVYGLLEFGVGAAALAVPALVLGAERLMVAMLGNQPAPPDSTSWLQTSFYLFTAFAVLVVPTALMGATLPLLARHAVHTEEQIGRRIGLLYGANTAGAVAGAIVAAFVLLPVMGLRGTVVVGAVLNVIVFCVAALIARSRALAIRHPPPWVEKRRQPKARTPWRARMMPGVHWILPIMLASGAASFVYEVLWTRMLSHILGSSLYAFAVMVASFLLGIALGSGLATTLTRTRSTTQMAFLVSQVAIAACSTGVYLALDGLVPEQAGLRGNIPLAIAVLLPSALFIGATFPLAVRILSDDPAAAAASAARVYTWNTVGAIAGALLAGFMVIPALRFEGTIHVAVMINLGLALLASLLFARPRLAWTGGIAVLALAALLVFRPEPPRKLLTTSPLNVTAEGELRYYELGRSASVVVLEHEGSLLLRTNGLPEAIIERAGTAPKFSGEFWLSPLAGIARPQAKSMLIVGYGGGIAVDGAPPGIRDIDVIELEPKVLEANRAIAGLRARDPLLDPRVNVIVNDARGALALTSKVYDAIVSQPSHPWTASASHLYTREFIQQARAHLAPGGLFVQWMNGGFIDEPLLRSLAATVLDVFEHVRLYRPDPSTLVFLASDGALDLEQGLAARSSPLFLYPHHYARFGIHTPEDLIAALVADQEGVVALARGAEVITDDRNRMVTAGAYDRRIGLSAQSMSRILSQYDPLQRRQSRVFTAPGFPLSESYLARRIALFKPIDPGVPGRLRRMAGLIADPSTAAYVAAIGKRSEGDLPVAQRLLQEALALDPANHAARFELIRPWLPALVQGRATDEVIALAKDLPRPAALLIEAGRHAVASEWARLPPMDGELRSAKWTDAWYFESVHARAEWRTRVTTPGLRARLGREALAIVDEAIVSQPTPTMYGLRARAALSADRPDVLIESLQGFAEGAVAIATPENRGSAQLRGSFDALIEMLDRTVDDKRVSATRRAAVRSKVLQARDELLGKSAAQSATAN